MPSAKAMDKQSPEVRKYIAQRADLLGAIRLPNNAFKAYPLSLNLPVYRRVHHSAKFSSHGLQDHGSFGLKNASSQP